MNEHVGGSKIIETSRLILRPFCLEDSTESFNNYTSDPLTTLYLTWDAHDNEQVTRDFIQSKLPLYEKDDFFDWCVTLKEANGTKIIGAISAVHFIKKDKFVEIGYCYGSAFWNKGYATEALKAVISYFFDTQDVDVVSCRYLSSNERSGHVMKKCHMRKKAVLKDFGYNLQENAREDIIIKAISRETYLKFEKDFKKVTENG